VKGQEGQRRVGDQPTKVSRWLRGACYAATAAQLAAIWAFSGLPWFVAALFVWPCLIVSVVAGHLFACRYRERAHQPLLRSARMRAQDGAASIEALGMMLLMVGMFMIVIFIGVAFYNAQIMNTTAQTMSLSAQTEMDRWCSPGFQLNCQMGEERARAAGSEIMAEAEKQLMFVKPGSFVAETDRAGSGSPITIQRTGRSTPSATPDNNGGLGGEALNPGWGYSFVRLQAQFSIWDQNGSAPIPGLTGAFNIGAQAITPSYKDPAS